MTQCKWWEDICRHWFGKLCSVVFHFIKATAFTTLISINVINNTVILTKLLIILCIDTININGSDSIRLCVNSDLQLLLVFPCGNGTPYCLSSCTSNIVNALFSKSNSCHMISNNKSVWHFFDWHTGPSTLFMKIVHWSLRHWSEF